MATAEPEEEEEDEEEEEERGAEREEEEEVEQAASAIPEPEDFETLATLGSGSFGRVDLVRARGSGRCFALKVLNIAEVVRMRQAQHALSEKAVLQEAEHPFIVRLHRAWHDERCLFLLLDFVPGGELFGHLRARGRLANNAAQFYAAEVVSALGFLHGRHIVYRDLKPENILLDREGHVRLTDFGFAKKLADRTWTLCGTPEYLAPELIQSRGHGTAVDWWALGVLIFEMLSGYPPFLDDSPMGVYQKILACRPAFPRHLDAAARDLISRLLVVDRTRRLGNLKRGALDVQRHRWFWTVDWAVVPKRRLKPPIVPHVAHDADASNFLPAASAPRSAPTPPRPPPAAPEDLALFAGF